MSTQPTMTNLPGLPSSPRLSNDLVNQDPQLNTPAVSPGEVNIDVVGMEARRVAKMASCMAISPEIITNTELGLATVRLANAIVQVTGGDIAHPWFGPAIEPILTQINNRFTQMENRVNDLQEQLNHLNVIMASK